MEDFLKIMAESEGQGDNVLRGRPRETNCSQAGDASSPKSPSAKCQPHKSGIRVALMAALFTTLQENIVGAQCVGRCNEPHQEETVHGCL